MMKYIAVDAYGIAIQAIGQSEEDVRRMALSAAGPLFDSQGNDLSECDALETFQVYEASPALIAQVSEEGGAIAWGYLADGTACTIEEEDNCE